MSATKLIGSNSSSSFALALRACVPGPRAHLSSGGKSSSVVFIPTFDASPLLESTGVGIMKKALEQGGRWSAIVEHAGPVAPARLLSDYYRDYMSTGMARNLSSYVTLNFTPRTAEAWFNREMDQDQFLKDMKFFLQTAKLPAGLHPFEREYYQTMLTHGAKIALEPRIDFRPWYDFMRAYLELNAMMPQEFARGRIEGDFGVMDLANQSAKSISDHAILRDEKIADKCKEQIDKGNSVLIVRGFSHVVSLIPQLIARGLNVDLDPELLEIAKACLTPFNLITAAQGANYHLGGLEKRNLVLSHIAYSILFPGTETQSWTVADWQAFQDRVSQTPPQAVEMFGAASARKYNDNISYSWRSMRNDFLAFLGGPQDHRVIRSSGEVDAVVSCPPRTKCSPKVLELFRERPNEYVLVPFAQWDIVALLSRIIFGTANVCPAQGTEYAQRKAREIVRFFSEGKLRMVDHLIADLEISYFPDGTWGVDSTTGGIITEIKHDACRIYVMESILEKFGITKADVNSLRNHLRGG